MAHPVVSSYQSTAAGQSADQKQHVDQPKHNWKAFSSHDGHLVDTVSRLAAHNPGIKKHVETLDKCGNVEVRLATVDNRDFKASLDTHLATSPQTVKYSIMDQAGRAGIYARELPRSPDAAQSGAPEKKVIQVSCTPDAGGLLSVKHLEGLLDHVAQYAETEKWPPIFAVLDRPAPSVSSENMEKLRKIPVEELAALHGKFLYDMGNCGFKHIEGEGRQVAPILTLKVASGDTEGTHVALERQAQRGDVLLIDGGYFHQDGKTPTYAYVGDMMRDIAISYGVKGFIVDGFSRDRAQYVSTDGAFFCFSKGAATPVTPNGPSKAEAGAVHLPIKGDGYAAKSNDICIVDGSHLFIVPEENVDAVIRVADGRIIVPAPNRIDVLRRQEALRITPAPVAEASAAAPKGKSSVISDELLDMLGRAPTAELSDSFSTLTPPKTVGIAIHTPEGAKTSNSVGIALVAGGSEDAIRRGIQTADTRTTLVIPAERPEDITLNSALVRLAQAKGLRAVMTGGTASLSEQPAIPVYAANFVSGDETLTASEAVSQQPVQMQGVEIRPGDTIVGDADGVAVVPPGTEEFALRGAHAIHAKESTAVPKIRAGEAPKRNLAYPLYPSGDPINADFIRTYIDCRSAPLSTARGSSGLKIPPAQGVQYMAAPSVQAGQSMQAALMQAFKSDAGQTLQAGAVVKGKPKQVFFDEGNAPVVVQLKQSSRIPFRSGSSVYVSGVQGDNFRTLMSAKKSKTTVVIDDRGDVKQRENGLKRFLAQFTRT